MNARTRAAARRDDHRHRDNVHQECSQYNQNYSISGRRYPARRGFSAKVAGKKKGRMTLTRPLRRIRRRVNQLREFPERCPRMTCSTNSSPNRLVNGPERNNKR